MPLKKDILSLIKTKDYSGLEHELKNLKTNQKFLNESLKWTCFEGDSKSVEILIKFGANANYTDEFGTTGLHFAVKSGKQDIIVALLNNGANYREWRMNGISLLQWCLRHGFDEVLDTLVRRFNIDLTEPDEMGRTSLHIACTYDQVKIVEYILETGLLSVDERDKNGWTPLHYACSEAGKNFSRMVGIMFKYNADPILLTTNNKTSLDLAYESGRAQQLIDALTVHKMLQLLISVDCIIVGKVVPQEFLANQSSSTGGHSIERHMTVKEKQYQAMSKVPDRHLALKLSIWRKVLLNDDVEILQEYRDSGVWYNSENPVGFEQCQKLTKDNFCQIFNDSYENGVGLFAYFNENFRKEINKKDFFSILTSICGLTKFQCLAADECVLFGSFHESILFLGLITGRFKVVEVLLRMRQFDIIPVCLMICLITRRLQHIKNFPPQIIQNLQTLSYKSEVIAVDVLTRVFFKDNSPEKHVTLQFINSELSSYGSKSLIDLADLANCSNFLSLPCCQIILDRRWYGNLRPLRSHLKWVIRFIPITILFYNPYYKKPVSDPPTRKATTKYRINDKRIFTRDKMKGRKKVSELDDFERQESYFSSSSCWEVLHAVVNAPGTKFFYHSTAHFIFLLIMSYTMLFDYDSRFQVEEILCYFFVLGYGIEETRQCVMVSGTSTIMDYLRDKWNWLDLSAIFSTLIGISLKMIVRHSNFKFKSDYDEATSTLLYFSRAVLLLGLLLFYLRILFIVSISAILGPKLRMIGDMLRKDFLPLLLIFFIFILAFGVLFQGILYPNGWTYKNAKKDLPDKMISNKRSEMISSLLIRAIYGIFEADFPIEETKCVEKDYCVHHIGRVLFLNFALILYIVIVCIMLMNLLIALFSNTVARIDQRSTEHWLAGRYKLVEEYKERSIFPPPFNILERIVDLLFYVMRAMRCSSCSTSLDSANKVVKQSESEINIVVKFIIIQSFTLKTCRQVLGMKDKSDTLSMSSVVDKKYEFDTKFFNEKLNTIEEKLDQILSVINDSGQHSNLTKSSEPTIFRSFSHLKYHPRVETKRSSMALNKDVDKSSVESSNQEWITAMDNFSDILDGDSNC